MTKEEEDWTNFENWSNLGLNPISVNKAGLKPTAKRIKPFGLGRGRPVNEAGLNPIPVNEAGLKPTAKRIKPFGLGRLAFKTRERT